MEDMPAIGRWALLDEGIVLSVTPLLAASSAEALLQHLITAKRGTPHRADWQAALNCLRAHMPLFNRQQVHLVAKYFGSSLINARALFL